MSTEINTNITSAPALASAAENKLIIVMADSLPRGAAANHCAVLATGLVVRHPDRKSTRLNSSHSLHDALPICACFGGRKQTHNSDGGQSASRRSGKPLCSAGDWTRRPPPRSEEHTSELQSLPTRRSSDLRLLRRQKTNS